MPGGAIQLFSDFACPFCYLAEVGAERLQQAGHAIEYRAFELRPVPVPLEAPSSDPVKQRGWDMLIAPMAERLGLSMKMPRLGVRTRKAHEAARHARTLGVERQMRNALFGAYFAEGLDIGRIDVLVEIGRKLGMDITELKVTLDIDQHSDAVVADAAAAVSLGLGGVPAYVRGDGSAEVVVGLQEYEALLDWVERTR